MIYGPYKRQSKLPSIKPAQPGTAGKPSQL